MGLLSARQAEMAEAVVSWSPLRSRIAMIDCTAADTPDKLNEETMVRMHAFALSLVRGIARR